MHTAFSFADHKEDLENVAMNDEKLLILCHDLQLCWHLKFLCGCVSAHIKRIGVRLSAGMKKSG